jgi:hypothetical protein
LKFTTANINSNFKRRAKNGVMIEDITVIIFHYTWYNCLSHNINRLKTTYDLMNRIKEGDFAITNIFFTFSSSKKLILV